VEYKEIEDLGLITLISKMGSLVVTVQSGEGNPLDATVTVKDAAGNIIHTITVAGGTASVDIVVGTYSLEADAEGFQTQVSTDITIESGTTVTQDFILTQAPGSISVYVTDIEGLPIADAEVALDGELVGATDETGILVIDDISPEDHAVSVAKEGYAPYKGFQTVDAGETVILDLVMEESGIPLTYVGIGVIIVAGLAGGLYFMRGRGGEPATRERKPPKGKERPRIPTGVRREGLPRQSYRGK